MPNSRNMTECGRGDILVHIFKGCIMQVNLDPELTRSLLFLDEQMLSEDPILSFLFVSIDNLPVLCSDLWKIFH